MTVVGALTVLAQVLVVAAALVVAHLPALTAATSISVMSGSATSGSGAVVERAGR